MIKMGFGIAQFTNVTLDNITAVANITEPAQLYINVNNMIYGGILIFLFLLGLMMLIFIKAQRLNDQPLVNLMYASAFVSLVAITGRIIFITVAGTQQSLISDTYMWVFPIITALLAGINWIIKKA